MCRRRESRRDQSGREGNEGGEGDTLRSFFFFFLAAAIWLLSPLSINLTHLRLDIRKERREKLASREKRNLKMAMHCEIPIEIEVRGGGEAEG
jgi:hypothetical protein